MMRQRLLYPRRCRAATSQISWSQITATTTDSTGSAAVFNRPRFYSASQHHSNTNRYSTDYSSGIRLLQHQRLLPRADITTNRSSIRLLPTNQYIMHNFSALSTSVDVVVADTAVPAVRRVRKKPNKTRRAQSGVTATDTATVTTGSATSTSSSTTGSTATRVINVHRTSPKKNSRQGNVVIPAIEAQPTRNAKRSVNKKSPSTPMPIRPNAQVLVSVVVANNGDEQDSSTSSKTAVTNKRRRNVPSMKGTEQEPVGIKVPVLPSVEPLPTIMPKKISQEVVRLHRLRRNASQFIPMWLRRDELWREEVFRHLNLPTNITREQVSDNNTYQRRNFGASLQGNFYENTIPSFSEVLRDGPPPSMYAALDILVAKGLGDANVAERYRTTFRLRSIDMDWVHFFNEKKKEIHYHSGIVQRINKEIDDLRKRLQVLEDAAPSASSATTISENVPQVLENTAPHTLNTGVIREIATPIISTPPEISGTDIEPTSTATTEAGIDLNCSMDVKFESPQSIELTVDVPTSIIVANPEIDPVAAENLRLHHILDLQKIISEKSDMSKPHQRKVDMLTKRIKTFRKEGKEPPMDDDEYQSITEAANMARPLITKLFANHARDLHSKTLERYQMLDSKTDLTKPHEWYLHARLYKRKIIYHGGPTNSGKTYQALQRLKAVNKGMYVGPLRLLAAEIWERLTADGIYCDLFTGQEVRRVTFATHKSATVEMASLTEDFDVVVIDEIQMINEKERGFAWTRAVLGLRCREIHVCGGLEATDVVKRLADACGDDFELRTYERFSELKIESSSLGSIPDQLGAYKQIQSGDCVVAFSRNDIFAIKREIETNTKHKCCVIYGSLPPSTRSEQARRFNDPNSGYDVLVASDAIGMGLNLNIRRVILNSIFKNDGQNIVRLDHSTVKQISGRAGRRNSPFPNGVVTTRDPRDLEYLRRCLTTDIEPIEKAGLLPTATHIQTFSDALELFGMPAGSKNLHTLLKQFNDIASVKSDFFVCRQDPMVNIAKAIAPYELAIPDKYMVCQSPVVSDRDTISMDIVRRFAAKKAVGQSSGLTKNMIPKPPKTFRDLARLCLIFNELELFLWLQRKFPPGNMIEQKAANTLRDRAIQYISEGLTNAEELDLNHCYVKRDRGVRKTWTEIQSAYQFDDEEAEFKNWNDNMENQNE